jgi:hypothetical protein
MPVPPLTLRRELLYALGCALFGLTILPFLLVLLGGLAIKAGWISPPVFPALSDVAALYRAIFSALLGSAEERDFLPTVLLFYCVGPYALFWIGRVTWWGLRGLRSARTI